MSLAYEANSQQRKVKNEKRKKIEKLPHFRFS